MNDYSESSEIINDDNAGNIQHISTLNSNRFLYLSQVNDRMFFSYLNKNQ